MCEVGLGIGGFEIICPFGNVLGVRRSGFTALMLASQEGHEAVGRALVELGAEEG